MLLGRRFSQAFREHQPDGQSLKVDAYFGTLLEEFLIALFERVVVTSTQVELMFSRLTKWTTEADTGIGHPSLTAKLVASQFNLAVRRWRTHVGGIKQPSGKKKGFVDVHSS